MSTKHSFQQYAILWAIAIALFMMNLDVTIISTAIPKMALSLHLNPINLKVAITSYLLTMAVFIPVSGWCADRWGARTVFIAALLLFTISSVLCGLAQNLTELVAGRLLQGIGAAFMTPVGRLILLKAFPRSELVWATNYYNIPAMLGLAIGPLLGGVIVTYIAWPWVFYANIPFGLLGIYFTLRYVTNYKKMDRPPFDAVGFVLFGLGLAGTFFVFSQIDEPFFPPFQLGLILLISLGLLALYFFHYKTAKNPVFDLKVFKIRTFGLTVLGGAVARVGIGGISFLLPLLFQLGLGMAAVYSGLLTFPFAIGMFTMKFFVPMLFKRFGFRQVLLSNTLLLSCTLFLFILIGASMPIWVVVILVFAHGLFTSLQFSALNVLSYVDLDEKNLSQGTSVASTLQQLSMSLGVVIAALSLKAWLHPFPLNGINQVAAFQWTFIMVGLITLAASLVFMRLHKGDGQGV